VNFLNRVLAELKITPNEQSPLGYANAKLSSADGSRTSCLDFLFCKKSNKNRYLSSVVWIVLFVFATSLYGMELDDEAEDTEDVYILLDQTKQAIDKNDFKKAKEYIDTAHCFGVRSSVLQGLEEMSLNKQNQLKQAKEEQKKRVFIAQKAKQQQLQQQLKNTNTSNEKKWVMKQGRYITELGHSYKLSQNSIWSRSYITLNDGTHIFADLSKPEECFKLIVGSRENRIAGIAENCGYSLRGDWSVKSCGQEYKMQADHVEVADTIVRRCQYLVEVR